MTGNLLNPIGFKTEKKPTLPSDGNHTIGKVKSSLSSVNEFPQPTGYRVFAGSNDPPFDDALSKIPSDYFESKGQPMVFVGAGGLGSLLLALKISQNDPSIYEQPLLIQIFDTSMYSMKLWDFVKKYIASMTAICELGGGLARIIHYMSLDKQVRNFTLRSIEYNHINRNDLDRWNEFADEISNALESKTGSRMSMNEKLKKLQGVISSAMISCVDWCSPTLSEVFSEIAKDNKLVLYPSNIQACLQMCAVDDVSDMSKNLHEAKHAGALVLETDLDSCGKPRIWRINCIEVAPSLLLVPKGFTFTAWLMSFVTCAQCVTPPRATDYNEETNIRDFKEYYHSQQSYLSFFNWAEKIFGKEGAYKDLEDIKKNLSARVKLNKDGASYKTLFYIENFIPSPVISNNSP